MTMLFKRIIDSVAKLLYPKQCMSCGKVLLKIEKEIGYCRDCIKDVKLVGGNTCMTCGKPISKSSSEYCEQCTFTKHQYNQNKGLFIYDGAVKKSMYQFKYSNKRCFAKYYGRFAYKKYGTWLKETGVEAIVPVPMYRRKMKKRGYNQAEVFARELSKQCGIPVYNDIINREKETVAMKELRGAKRKKNLLNAFKMTENIVKFRKVLVVDDIYTTGTTIDEVARVLKSGGISEVYGLCICIGKS